MWLDCVVSLLLSLTSIQAANFISGLESARLSANGGYMANFSCNLMGRYVTVQQYKLNTAYIYINYVPTIIYNSFGINEITFYALLN